MQAVAEGRNFLEIFLEKGLRIRIELLSLRPDLKGSTVDSVAQLVEQYTFNVWALGSSPSGITKESH